MCNINSYSWINTKTSSFCMHIRLNKVKCESPNCLQRFFLSINGMNIKVHTSYTMPLYIISLEIRPKVLLHCITLYIASNNAVKETYTAYFDKIIKINNSFRFGLQCERQIRIGIVVVPSAYNNERHHQNWYREKWKWNRRKTVNFH